MRPMREDTRKESFLRRVGKKYKMAEQDFGEDRKSPKSRPKPEVTTKEENDEDTITLRGNSAGRLNLSEKEIFHHLYEHNKIQAVSPTSSGIKKELQNSRTLTTLPSEVVVCSSSIPGASLGVMTRCHMPAGTVIGPFEGRVVLPENVTPGADTTHLWEIYRDGRIVHFIDGSDDKFSCWMRHIQCARHNNEQNLYAFQYQENIYYRTREAIEPGRELLVWYDSSYKNFMGIPYGIQPRARHEVCLPGPAHAQQYVQSATRIPAFPEFHPYWQSRTAPVHKHKEAQLSPPKSSIKNRNRPSPPPSVGHSDQSTTSHGDKSPTEPSSPRAVDYTEWNLWKCGMCHKTFTQRIMLQIHVCPSAPIKPYQCGHCSLAFTQPNELRHHMVTHTTDRPFKCGFCSRTFAGATTLHNHIRTHTGDKPFACDECGQSFSQAAQLSKHQKTPSECPGQ